MKKQILALMLLAGLSLEAFADWDIHGQIKAVNPAKKTITLAGGAYGEAIEIQILPYTEIKGDDCGQWGNDIYGTFADLSVGKIVKAEVYPANMQAGVPMMGGMGQAQNPADSNATQPTNPTGAVGGNTMPSGGFVAKEIEWKCMPRAY